MNTTMADGAEQRLDAQIAEALFGQPGMSKMDVANLVRELRGDGPALLVPRKAGQNAMVPHARALELVGDAYNAGTHGIGYSQQAMELHDSIISAQPSPGGQRGGLRYLTQRELDSIGSQAEGMDGEQWDRWVQAKFAEVNGLATVDSDGFTTLAARQPDAAIGGDEHDIEDPCDVITRAAQKLSAAGQPRIADRLVRARTEVERLQAAYLAARQPVGEPVAVIENGAFGGGGLLWIGPMPPIGTKLYAAPPAQAVDQGRWSQGHAEDLEQAIHTALSAHAGSLSQKKRKAISDYVKRLLIDSQAVGNG